MVGVARCFLGFTSFSSGVARFFLSFARSFLGFARLSFVLVSPLATFVIVEDTAAGVVSYHSAVHPNDAAQRLALYKSVVQQWSANLFELDEHATYRLLAAGDMSGVTGDRGNRIVASAPALWAWLGLLRDRVEEIEQMGESKTLFDDKTTEIEELIIGKNISISRSSLPDYLPPVVARKFKDRDGDPIDLETNCHGLVETFRAVYNPVRDIVAEVDAVWSDLIPRIEAATTTLCLLYTSPSPRDATLSRMPSSA